MMSPEESIGLEHRTRSLRLQRLVREFGIYPAPAFFDYTIPAYVMPEDFKHQTPVLRVVFPENTFFDTASSDIVPSARPIVAAMAEMLQGDVPDVAMFVAGHTDSRGAEDYNHNLSIRRARAVAQALRDAGANGPDIWSVGFGESLPLYENSNAINMSYNRRVEFLFAARLEAVANWLKDQQDLACSDSANDARIRCLESLKLVKKTYLVEPVERRVMVAPSMVKTITEKPKRSQIVINLTQHSFVVKHPEL
ncbi:MAG: OmpA family protein [Caulobacteraceae bacterium]|nr:OmpA family protein [Caulobacteraceae bacterium]